MASFKSLDDLDQLGDLNGRKAIVRVDLNVPMEEGAVSDDTRLLATLRPSPNSPTRA